VGYRRGVALANTRLGAVSVLNHQYDQALGYLKTALDGFTALRDEYGRADALLAMGLLRIQEGRTSEAMEVLQQALHYFQSAGNVKDTLSSCFLLAQVAIQERRLSDAQSELDSLVRDAVKVKLQVSSEDERMLYVATIQDYYGLLARTLLQLDQAEPGKGLILHAFEIFERATSQALIEKLALQQRSDTFGTENPLQFRPGIAQSLLEQLPRHSVLLGYFLNRYCSCAFVVTPDQGIKMFTLSDPEQISRIAALAAHRVRASATATPNRELRQLSDMLLKPAAPQLQGRRDIIVVSQGRLDLLPFVLLPDPNDPAKLMIDSHDVVQSPSASYLAVAQANLSQEHQKELLVFADPVLDMGDPRLKSRTLNSVPEGTVALSRLVFTRLEAEQITSELHKGQYTEVYGFAFAKKAIQSKYLNRYQYLHFATHAQEGNGPATRGALLLSRFNEAGRNVPYLLTSDEIVRSISLARW